MVIQKEETVIEGFKTGNLKGTSGCKSVSREFFEKVDRKATGQWRKFRGKEGCCYWKKLLLDGAMNRRAKPHQSSMILKDAVDFGRWHCLTHLQRG